MRRPHDSGAHARPAKENREYSLVSVTPSLRVYRIASDQREGALYQLEQTQGRLFPGEPSVCFLEDEVPELVGALLSAVAAMRPLSSVGAGEGLAPPASMEAPSGNPKAYFLALVHGVVEQHVALERKAIAADLVDVHLRALSRAIVNDANPLETQRSQLEGVHAGLAALAGRLAEGRR